MEKSLQLTRRLFLTGLAASSLAACATAPQPRLAVRRESESDRALRLLAAAASQIGRTQIYDPAYQAISYPGGDIPLERGVCSDVVIRAYRQGLNCDLQKLVHEDMSVAFDQYPNLPKWGLSKPDPNIDHRRVLNLMVFFRRQGAALPVTHHYADYRPGDLVTQTLPGDMPHISIVADHGGFGGAPRIVHNCGKGTQFSTLAFSLPITGHYRYLPQTLVRGYSV
ncbi:MAG: DUF1287 domain-containing protein [Rhizobiales bacterium]|nr:DUF1287 domain-containing protein [Hyphomicrobiales bacterium]